MAEVYYRFEDRALWEDSAMGIDLYEFRVVRRTPKGCFIARNGFCRLGYRQHDPGKKDRFILDGAKKRYAYPTIEEARQSFIARKKMQLRHAKRAEDFATAALDIIQREDFVPNKAFQHQRLRNYHCI